MLPFNSVLPLGSLDSSLEILVLVSVVELSSVEEVEGIAEPKSLLEDSVVEASVVDGSLVDGCVVELSDVELAVVVVVKTSVVELLIKSSAFTTTGARLLSAKAESKRICVIFFLIPKILPRLLYQLKTFFAIKIYFGDCLRK